MRDAGCKELLISAGGVRGRVGLKIERREVMVVGCHAFGA